jgi:hypothetical protein
VTPRATDSGYSILTDTGQYAERVGLNRFSVQIFNTADDTGFYDIGSQYHVAIDSVTVDGRTVRFFPAVFEIGETRANIVQIDGDTGAADRLGKLAGLQLKADGTFDTGTGQTTNTFNVTATATTDTGAVSNAVWNSGRSAHTAVGSFGQYVNANIDLIDGDTGAATHLKQLMANGFNDTGINERLAAIETQTNKLTFDTGNEIQADIRKVNNISVDGSGTGSDPWGPV